MCSEEIVAYVKREFLKRGYYAPDFGGLPSDMQYGSRELLLALGWLLSNEQIFEKLAMDRTSALDDDTRGMYEVRRWSLPTIQTAFFHYTLPAMLQDLRDAHVSRSHGTFAQVSHSECLNSLLSVSLSLTHFLSLFLSDSLSFWLSLSSLSIFFIYLSINLSKVLPLYQETRNQDHVWVEITLTLHVCKYIHNTCMLIHMLYVCLYVFSVIVSLTVVTNCAKYCTLQSLELIITFENSERCIILLSAVIKMFSTLLLYLVLWFQEEILKSGDKNSMNLQMVPDSDVYDRVKQLLWLNNKLRLNLCSLYGMLCQRNRLKHKVRNSSRAFDR